MKRAVVTGANGQTGSYAIEMLLEYGYQVYGVVRRSSVDNTERISHINDNNLRLVEGDVTDFASMSGIINMSKPELVFHLAAQSHVFTSFEQPILTLNVNLIGTANILNAIKEYSPNSRLLHAATSEMFGSNYSMRTLAYTVGSHDEDNYYTINAQSEETKLEPKSPYGVSKVAAYHLVKNYRESYNLFACSSICFNHESPRRGYQFVTRKITRWIGQFYRWYIDRVILKEDEDHIYGVLRRDALEIGKDYNETGELIEMEKFPKLRLGNIEAKRDFGFAGDYVKAMYLMLQHDKPIDYVIATGETHSIREFLDVAFGQINIKDWSKYIVIDPKFYRPSEVDYLLGDSSKIRKELGWKPSVNFEELIEMMVKADLYG